LNYRGKGKGKERVQGVKGSGGKRLKDWKKEKGERKKQKDWRLEAED